MGNNVHKHCVTIPKTKVVYMPFLTPNQEWAAEQIIDRMERDDIDPKNKVTIEDIRAMNAALNKLDSILYKSWAKLLTLDNLREVFEDVMLEKNIKP